MAGMEGLGRLFNVVPIAASRGLAMNQCSAITFVCTGSDTYTITVASSFGGSYVSPGSILTRLYKSTATNGTAAWTKTLIAAADNTGSVTNTVAFTIFGSMLADPKNYIKVTPGSSGLVTAILHDLTVQRAPANLPVVSD